MYMFHMYINGGGHRGPSQDPEGKLRSTQCKQRPPQDLWCLLAAKTRGLHILTIIIAFCSFSINLTCSTLFLVALVGFLGGSPFLISPSARSVATQPNLRPGSIQAPRAPHLFFFFFKYFCDNQEQTFLPLQARHWPLFQGNPSHTCGHLVECSPPPPTYTHTETPHPPVDSRYLCPHRSLLPQDKTPSIQNQTHKYFCFYFTK